MSSETPEYIFELPIKVRDYEVDCEGIVNNANYLHYLEHTRHEFCEKVGFTFREMHESGIDPVVSRVEIDYKKSLGLGDTMVSKLYLKRKGPLIVFFQDIYTVGGDPVIKAKVYLATTVKGRLTRGLELYDKFKDYMIND